MKTIPNGYWNQGTFIMKRNTVTRRAFTLIELIAVVVILAILSGVALPKYFDYAADAKKSACKGALGGVRAAIANFYANSAIAGTATYPTLAELETVGTVLQEQIPENPYQTDFDVIAAVWASPPPVLGSEGEPDHSHEDRRCAGRTQLPGSPQAAWSASGSNPTAGPGDPRARAAAGTGAQLNAREREDGGPAAAPVLPAAGRTRRDQRAAPSLGGRRRRGDGPANTTPDRSPASQAAIVAATATHATASPSST